VAYMPDWLDCNFQMARIWRPSSILQHLYPLIGILTLASLFFSNQDVFILGNIP
jgi:hypothetical protein